MKERIYREVEKGKIVYNKETYICHELIKWRRVVVEIRQEQGGLEVYDLKGNLLGTASRLN
jgi:hypothetical protein|nr:MAG TPA: hypothetical protein [Caudoviricetes sp.]